MLLSGHIRCQEVSLAGGTFVTLAHVVHCLVNSHAALVDKRVSCVFNDDLRVQLNGRLRNGCDIVKNSTFKLKPNNVFPQPTTCSDYAQLARRPCHKS